MIKEKEQKQAQAMKHGEEWRDAFHRYIGWFNASSP